jgi:hypothetical protein
VGGIGVEKKQQEIPSSWLTEARRTFPACNAPTKFLRLLAARGFTDQEGAEYLAGSRRATDLPKVDHRALAVWCSGDRSRPWLERRRRRSAAATVAEAADRPLTAAEIAKNRQVALKGGADLLRSLRKPAAAARSAARSTHTSSRSSKALQRGA